MSSAHTDTPWFDIVYEDDAIIIVNKRAAVATMGVDENTPEVLAGLRTYLSPCSRDPFIGILGRLDYPVSGLLVVAKSAHVARQLVKQRDDRRMVKSYDALVAGRPPRETDTLTNWLLKSKRHRRVSIVAACAEYAQFAKLSYEVMRTGPQTTLLRVNVWTGRKHQIRAQLGHLGNAILGDRKYGSKLSFPQGIALLCKRIKLSHPIDQTPVSWEVDYPSSWAGNEMMA